MSKISRVNNLVSKVVKSYKRYGFQGTAHKIVCKYTANKMMRERAAQNRHDCSKLFAPIIPCAELVSVVIPSYNGAEELASLIPVLEAQVNVEKIEIIVVDSGSRDGTAALAEKLGAKVIRISQEDFSHSYARNLGASHAAGKYLLFMTQDALPNGTQWLCKMLQPILKEMAVAVSCRQIPKPDCDLFGRFQVYSHAKYMGILSEDRILSLPKVQNCETLRLNAQLDDVSCLILRDVFQKYQYRGNYAEDLDLGVRLIRDHYKLALLSSAQVIHSHNRLPYYYLRRSIVDTKATKQILPDLPMERNVSAQKCANCILSAYACLSLFLKEAVNYIGDLEQLNDFLTWSSQTLCRNEARLAKATGEESMEQIRTEFPYMDEATKNFVYQVAELYGEQYSFDPMIIADQQFLIERVLPGYLKEFGEIKAANLKLEICKMLCQYFAQFAGNSMAVLLLYGKDGPLKQVAAECCAGV